MPKGVYEHTHTYEWTEAHRTRAAAHMLSIRLDRDDPRAKDASHRGGVEATRQVWMCDDCGLTTTTPAIGSHQSRKHHDGRTFIGYRDNDDNLGVTP